MGMLLLYFTDSGKHNRGSGYGMGGVIIWIIHFLSADLTGQENWMDFKQAEL